MSSRDLSIEICGQSLNFIKYRGWDFTPYFLFFFQLVPNQERHMSQKAPGESKEAPPRSLF